MAAGLSGPVSPERGRLPIRLTAIDAAALLAAIGEFNRLGRTKFLAAYGFSRSSKFYAFHQDRLYDTKALVAAAFRHAMGKRIGNHQFSGGAQTTKVLVRIKKQDLRFRRLKVFEDSLGELRNLSGEYDRIPRAFNKVKELGFSKWIPLARFRQLNTGELPGVYVVAASRSQPFRISIVDPCVVYVGETVGQSLHKRLYQLGRSLRGKLAHSGGLTLGKKGFKGKSLWLAIRSFPLAYGMTNDVAEALRSSQIRSLERTILHEYVLKNERYPAGNSK